VQPESLAKLAADLGVADAVRLDGAIPHDDLPTYYRAADAVLIPSRSESFGLVAIEALASGLPVVGTAVGCIPGVVVDGWNGYVVEHPSPRHFAARLQALLLGCDPGRTPQAALESSAEYDWRRTASRLAALYDG
jgi:D-inositol-3-phosphate glycosyltransferase